MAAACIAWSTFWNAGNRFPLSPARSGALTKEEDTFHSRCARLGFDISRGTISHIETGLRGVSDLGMVLLAKALRVELDELVPGELPAWEKDLRPPTARAGDGE